METDSNKTNGQNETGIDTDNNKTDRDTVEGDSHEH